MVNGGPGVFMAIDLNALTQAAVLQVQEHWVAIAAALVSVVSAIMAAAQKRQERRIAWTRDVITWASNAMVALSRAQVEMGALSLDADRLDRSRDIRIHLSAAVDQGRLFFENKQDLRPELLDPLVRAFELLAAVEVEPQRYTKDHLLACMHRHRSEFWRMVQQEVKPNWIAQVMQGSTSRAGAGAWDFDQSNSSST